MQDHDKSGLASIAFSGDASQLTGIQSFALKPFGGGMSEYGIKDFNDAVANSEALNAKLDNPENHYNSTEGQILMRTEDGSKWIDLYELKGMLEALQ